MAQSEQLATVIVFDLDDTLYKEIDYQNSGFNAVCIWVNNVYGLDLTIDLKKFLASKTDDILGELCKSARLQPSVKDTLLWVYRLHQPSIQLWPGVIAFLNELKANCQAAILTDGRSVSQRLKIKALGLTHLPMYISEDYDSFKPCLKRFELIMHEMPARRYIYVGDNPLKDFIAPNNLGWTSICLRDDGRNVHSQDVSGLDPIQLPKIWIDSLDELNTLIC